MNNYGNKKAFSLIIAILLTILMALLAFYILEYMVPFSKNIKGIENASKAYYQAESAVEEGLLFIKENDLGIENSISFSPVDAISSSYDITAEGKELPPTVDGIVQGNSEFDSEWNIIRSGDPIQLEVGNKLIGTAAKIEFIFRVPDLNGPNDSAIQKFNIDSIPIINWQLSSPNGVLNSINTSRIYNDKINDSNSNSATPGLWVAFESLDGINLEESPQTFKDFYKENVHCKNNGCILKISVINKLKLTDGTAIPYIEWKAKSITSSIPLRYTIIDTSGKSHGFKKDLKVKIPQQTVNEAFDFTVFQ